MAEDTDMTDGPPLAPTPSSAIPSSTLALSTSHPGTIVPHLSSTTSITWDARQALPLSNVLREDGLILLLTPVAVHPDGNPNHTADPFEPLGKAIAERHPYVRHVPYTKTGGITAVHTAFIQRASVVIFVATGLPANENDPSQLEYVDVVRILCEERPLVVVACFDFDASDFSPLKLPTIVHARGYHPSDLEEAARLLFAPAPWRDAPSPSYRPSMLTTMQPASEVTESHQAALAVQARVGGTPMVSSLEPSTPSTAARGYSAPMAWDLAKGEVHPIFALWEMCMPPKFVPSIQRLEVILRRPGYATHYIIRNNAGSIIGFCATFVNYLTHVTEDFAGCIAAVIVHPDYRHMGIGTMLYKHAYAELSGNPKLVRIQLGSTFPRLLYGIPANSSQPTVNFFRKFDWSMDLSDAGHGLEVTDWLLDFGDLPGNELSSAGLTFKCCESDQEFLKVLQLVENVAIRRDYHGWYEQYAASGAALENIIVGMEGQTVVTIGLLYYPGFRTQSDVDLPWADRIGPDVGGLTCICIKELDGNAVVRPDAIMIRLLDKCVRVLRERGKRRLFIDAARGGEQGFLSLGFRKWASYFECYKDIRPRSPLPANPNVISAAAVAAAAAAAASSSSQANAMPMTD